MGSFRDSLRDDNVYKYVINLINSKIPKSLRNETCIDVGVLDYLSLLFSITIKNKEQLLNIESNEIDEFLIDRVYDEVLPIDRFKSKDESVRRLLNSKKFASNKKILMYHGSDIAVISPEIRLNKFTKDFGIGFYVTDIKRQAEQWAMRKRKAVVSVYELDLNYSKLNNLKFDSISEEWLDCIAYYRSGLESKFDTIEGSVADDKVYDYVNSYLAGKIDKIEFMYHCKYYKLTHQMVFKTQSSLEYLKFKEWYNV